MLADGVEIGSSNGVYVLSAKQRRMSSLNSYVCTSCGYMEHYIAEQAVLDEIAQAGRWARVPRL
jgi:hypothetical protein